METYNKLMALMHANAAAANGGSRGKSYEKVPKPNTT